MSSSLKIRVWHEGFRILKYNGISDEFFVVRCAESNAKRILLTDKKSLFDRESVSTDGRLALWFQEAEVVYLMPVV